MPGGHEKTASGPTRCRPGAQPTVHSEPAATISLRDGAAAEVEPRHLPQAEIEVTVVEARGLAAMDMNGRSDPYAVLHCGRVQCKTRCQHKTLNPQWGETFRFEVVPGPASVLQLDVFDHDVFSDDDFLGSFGGWDDDPDGDGDIPVMLAF